MGVYDRAIASAQRIIRAKGDACVWHPAVTPEAETDTPWIETEPEGDVVTHAVSIAIFPVDRRYAEMIRYMKDSEVVVGSLYGLMGEVAFTPSIEDIVVRSSGQKLAIVSISPLAPNGDVILYTIEFKT